MTTSERTMPLWMLIVGIPIFIVGFYFFLLAGATMMALVTALVDGFPAWYVGPDPTGVDQVFIRDVLRLDHWTVGLVGLQSPWLVLIPGCIAASVWEFLKDTY